jgi:hypothetical protein|tara:strand:+ start:347 stop:526 length:180 start_codon:yes stop_codon:yes gene_type:complete
MKLPGVTAVKIEAGAKPKTQKVTVTTDKAGITKEAAVKSLGKAAKKFVVKTWAEPSDDA